MQLLSKWCLLFTSVVFGNSFLQYHAVTVLTVKSLPMICGLQVQANWWSSTDHDGTFFLRQFVMHVTSTLQLDFSLLNSFHFNFFFPSCELSFLSTPSYSFSVFCASQWLLLVSQHIKHFVLLLLYTVQISCIFTLLVLNRSYTRCLTPAFGLFCLKNAMNRCATNRMYVLTGTHPSTDQ